MTSCIAGRAVELLWYNISVKRDTESAPAARAARAPAGIGSAHPFPHTPTAMNRTLLALCIAAAFAAPLPLIAADADAPLPASDAAPPDGTATPADGTPHHDEQLEAVVVRASPLRQTSDQVIAPVAVLSGAELDDARSATLGAVVARLPGVQTTYFGPGVGRPVVRGLDGPRVGVLNDGMAASDVSNVSQDHAVTLEPFLANQIEVLKGPRTLLYGPGAIGGVVNVADGRIPESAPANGATGRAEINGDSVSHGGTGMARLDAGGSNYALHIDGLYRETQDYDTPEGVLENSAVKTRSGAIGGSVFGDWGFLGASVSRFLTDYGVPNGTHSHDHEHEHEHAAGGDDEHEEENVTIGMRQTRYDVKGGLQNPFAGIETLRFGFARTVYDHTEFENGQTGTQFFADTNEARLELVHAPLAGWRGAFGVQGTNRHFDAIGEEAFVPPTRSDNLGLFLTEQREWDRLTLELGARVDRTRLDPTAVAPHDHEHEHAHDEDDHPIGKRDFTSTSFSFGAGWRLADAWHLKLNLDRAQRAPAEEELFADGAHVATSTWEIGNAQLGKETSNQAELGLHYHSEFVEAKLAAYLNRFDDYIYLADTGTEEDGLPVREWTQANARFHGLEAEATFHLARGPAGHWDLRVWGDTVRARLDDGGGNLPRIPAARFGSSIHWSNDLMRASLGVVRYFDQDRVTAYETPTDGFTLVDANVAWTVHSSDRTSVELFANGSNLTNQTARLATSYIKDVAPLPGRSVVFGVRAFF